MRGHREGCDAKTNHGALLTAILAVYTAYLSVWFLEPPILPLAVITAVFAYLAAVVLYAAKNGYSSSVYFAIVVVAALFGGVMVLTQLVAILS